MNAVMQAAPEVDDQTAATVLDFATLSVLSGNQQGACAYISPDLPVTIGSSLDSDIVLRDASIHSVHAIVTLMGNELRLDCCGDQLSVDQATIASGEAFLIDQSAVVTIGDINLSLAIGHDALNQSLPNQSEQAINAGLNTTPPGFGDDAVPTPDFDYQVQAFSGMHSQDELQQGDAAVSVDGAEMSTVDQLPEPVTRNRSGFMTLGVLFVGALVVWQSGLFSPDVSPQIPIDELLAASPYREMVIEQGANSTILRGYLSTYQEAAELDRWLDRSGVVINNQVLIGERVAERVLGVFRVHGVKAQVSVSATGDVTANTQESDLNLLAAVEHAVIDDVPEVASLAIANAAPAKVEPVNKLILDKGKRVALVVSDDPAYIVTEDKSRYFVGAILPSGHRISSIVDGTVMLELDGVETVLEF